jgi:hypothetical protein
MVEHGQRMGKKILLENAHSLLLKEVIEKDFLQKIMRCLDLTSKKMFRTTTARSSEEKSNTFKKLSSDLFSRSS